MIRLTLGRVALAAAFAWTATPPASAQQNLSPQTQQINKYIAEGWKRAEIKKPAAVAGDTEFARRAFIDIIGRIANPEEILDFERDTGSNKRVRLVHRLMNDPAYTPKVNGKPGMVMKDGKLQPLTLAYTEEYATHWANLWSVWLMTRTGNKLYRDQMQAWLEVEFFKEMNHKQMVTRLITAKGKTGGDDPVGFVMHHLGEKLSVDELKEGKFGLFDAVPVTSRVTKLFLGLQTQCTQCHDHPFNKEWLQSDFWGVNAFFRQTVRDKTPTGGPVAGQMMVDPVVVEVKDDDNQNAQAMVLYEKRDGKRMASKPIFLKDVAQAEKGDPSDKTLDSVTGSGGKTRRQLLAEFVVKHDNFGKAYVNRVWGHLFGRGLNKDAPVDDFGSHNEVMHPELLSYLAEEFAKYDYNPKMLIEWIATSEAYSLSHVSNPAYTDPKYDPYFARMTLKALSPEVLLKSVVLATDADVRRTPDEYKKFEGEFINKLVKNFGDDEGNELVFSGTVVQALLMMNGKEINGEIGSAKGKPAKAESGIVAGIVAKHARGAGASPPAIYDDLFLTALNRHVTPVEVRKFEEVRNGLATVKVGAAPAPPAAGNKPKKPNPKAPAGGATAAPGAAPADVAFYQDVFWALLNSSEFILNH